MQNFAANRIGQVFRRLMPTNLKQITSGIAAWPEDERPRERLLTRGSYALSDAELLAILLRVGMRGKSAVELGRELLIRFGSVPGMMAAPISAWEGIKGLGDARHHKTGKQRGAKFRQSN